MQRDFTDLNSNWDQTGQRNHVGKSARVQPNSQVRLINKSGADVYIGQVLDPVRVFPTLDFGADLDPGSDDMNFVNTQMLSESVIVECEEITALTRQVVVAASAIPNNGSGIGFIGGVCITVVKVTDPGILESDTLFAYWEAGEQNLTLNEESGYRVLWISKEFTYGSDPDEHATALIDLSMGGGGGATATQLQFLVRNIEGHQTYVSGRMIEICGYQYGFQDGSTIYPTAYLGRLPTYDSLTNVMITLTSISAGPQGTGYATYDPFTSGIALEYIGAQGYQYVPPYGRRLGSQAGTNLALLGNTGWVVIGPQTGYQDGSGGYIGPQYHEGAQGSVPVRPQWA